ncbi:MAG: hypothetical protein HYY17_00020 [Planctomycetes bacterium]|nr:hypothetical protein [Planctomycetota bacterium]
MRDHTAAPGGPSTSAGVGPEGPVRATSRPRLSIEGVKTWCHYFWPPDFNAIADTTEKDALTFPGDHVPDFYLGIQIHSDGSFTEVFNGPGSIAAKAVDGRKTPKNNLYSDLTLIESGQGRTVLARAAPRWQAHLGWTFEEAARAHARRLIARGELPSDLVVGRWWAATGEPCEVDVLGLRGTRTALLGEARWQSAPLGPRDLDTLRSKLARAPRPTEDPKLVLWGRAGATREVRRGAALAFDAGDVLT